MHTQPTPLLQIIHYSDIHLSVSKMMLNRWLVRHLPLDWQQGLGGARRAILTQFLKIIPELTVNDSIWSSLPTWLVDTGDGTTFGEDAALREWRDWAQKIALAAGVHGAMLRVYGNHDAWPEHHPLRIAHTHWKMDQHRDMLRKDHFPDTWPDMPLAVNIPNTSSRIELCAVNTVDHLLWPNVFALGVAARDRDWTHLPQIPRPTPAEDLASRANLPATRHARDLRIAAMHYPVADHATAGNPTTQKILRGRNRFARELQHHQNVSPFVTHLMLAGHTHEPFPAIGALPRNAFAANHTPLVAGQCQIVTASLSQDPNPRGRLPASASWREKLMYNNPHQFTLLRFYQSTTPYELCMERTIFGAGDSGRFHKLPIREHCAEVSEQMRIML